MSRLLPLTILIILLTACTVQTQKPETASPANTETRTAETEIVLNDLANADSVAK